jgi:hypothetical protein
MLGKQPAGFEVFRFHPFGSSKKTKRAVATALSRRFRSPQMTTPALMRRRSAATTARSSVSTEVRTLPRRRCRCRRSCRAQSPCIARCWPAMSARARTPGRSSAVRAVDHCLAVGIRLVYPIVVCREQPAILIAQFQRGIRQRARKELRQRWPDRADQNFLRLRIHHDRPGNQDIGSVCTKPRVEMFASFESTLWSRSNASAAVTMGQTDRLGQVEHDSRLVLILRGVFRRIPRRFSVAL